MPTCWGASAWLIVDVELSDPGPDNREESDQTAGVKHSWKAAWGAPTSVAFIFPCMDEVLCGCCAVRIVSAIKIYGRSRRAALGSASRCVTPLSR